MSEPIRQFRRRAMLAGLLVLLIAGWAYVQWPLKLNSPTAMNNLPANLKPLFAKTKTVCVGRFLLDVPQEATLTHSFLTYDYNDIEVQEQRTKGEFLRELAAEEARLKNTPHYREPNGLLRAVHPGAYPDSKLFVHREDASAGYIMNITGHAWLRGAVVKVSGQADDDKTHLGVADIQKILGHLRPRMNNEIPEEEGFCIPSGFIAGSDWGSEEVSLYVTLPGNIEFWVNTGTNNKKLQSSLSEDLAEQLTRFGHIFSSNETRLLGGNLNIGRIEGEQTGIGANQNGNRYQMLEFLSVGKVQSLKEPRINVRLTTGHGPNSSAGEFPNSLTDKDAMALWDALLSTLRVRPIGPVAGKGETAASTKPSRLPLGSTAASWTACPQTGIWECAEPTLAYGERRRRLEAGKRMPIVAVMADAQRGLAKWLGKKEENAIDTTWTLVAYDEQAQG